MQDSYKSNCNDSILLKSIELFQSGIEEKVNFLNQNSKFYKGIIKYQQNSYIRTKKSYKVVWQKGSVRVFEYGDNISKSDNIILFIPSLINKSYIFDMEKNISMIDYLVENNIKAYLIDFSDPLVDELHFKMENYLTERISPIIEFLYSKHNKSITVAGYCMGGLFTLASAIISASYIDKIILLATPYRYDNISVFNNFKYYLEQLSLYEDKGKVPPKLIYKAFCLLDPLKVCNKFIKYNDYKKGSKKEKKFVIVEKWINDGISVSNMIIKEFIINFLIKNVAYENKWIVAGNLIDPSKISQKVLVALPIKDNIVPTDSSAPLVELIKDCEVLTVNSGHIGMIIGDNAKKQLWTPILSWLKSN